MAKFKCQNSNVRLSPAFSHKVLFFFFFILLSYFGYSQDWSPPIFVTGGAMYSSPDFSIRKPGKIWCVWSKYINTSEYKIFGASSNDYGLTWSAPEQIAYIPGKWLYKPKVVIDMMNVPYVSYLYDVANYQKTQIFIKRYFNGYWNDPVLVSGSYTGMQNSDLFIDHNNTIYSFWNIGFYPVYMFLNYKLITQPDWSGVLMPFSDGDSYQVTDCDIDLNNNLHCLAKQSTPTIPNSLRMVYFKGAYDTWEQISTPQIDSISSGSISTDKQGVQHCAFRRYYHPDTNHQNYGFTYTKFNQGEWSPQIPIVLNKTSEDDLVIDYNGNLHFVANEEGDSLHYLVYFFFQGDVWVKGVLEENRFRFSDNKLIAVDSTLFWLYLRRDSLNMQEGHYYSSICIRRLEIPNMIVYPEWVSRVRIYPNPITNNVTVELSMPADSFSELTIHDLKGNLLTSLREDNLPHVKVFTWNCGDLNGNRVLDGIYLLKVNDGGYVKVFPIIVLGPDHQHR